jgi:hypothetical protein
MVNPLKMDIKIKAIDIPKNSKDLLSKTNLSLLYTLRERKNMFRTTVKPLIKNMNINILLTISIAILF